jgi:DEAD/DEAH box helicase domain-containing protein
MFDLFLYDIEIEQAIPNGDKIPGIRYCHGWTDYEGMGISVIGYQWKDEEPNHCLSIGEFSKLLYGYKEKYRNFRMLGFNSRSFDDKILNAFGIPGIQTQYDILEEVREAAGHHPRKTPKGHTYTLDAIAKANNLGGKSGDGAMAPVYWQRAEYQRVIDYCKFDIFLTRSILDLGLAGELIDPNTGKKLQFEAIR